MAAAILALVLLRQLQVRLRLSRAKHPSLAGHARISRRVARLIPFYEYDEDEFFRCDGADEATAARRREGFERLGRELREKAPATLEHTRALESGVSDMQFTNANRVPFQFRSLVQKTLPLGGMAEATDGVRVRSLDGNWSYDVSGSYGVNLLGYDFYKECIRRGVERVDELGPILGPYHPLIADNVDRIREISGLDEVSFHMSGTEAVMQAVRLARFHTQRSQLVTFTGAYHGWWDGVQSGGHSRSLDDIYMLSDMSEDTLRVLRTRKDIACVLVNPLQALHPNASASSDAMLIDGSRKAGFDRESYSDWLRSLREVCTERGIVLIFDEVFVGFRLGVGGAQEYFGVRADMVTYGKTIGGGLPIGVLAGRADLMRRFRDDRPADLCFARGTFNSHPYVMATMNEFLQYAMGDEFRKDIDAADALWNERVRELNSRFEARALPLRVCNLSSIWIMTYTQPSRYHWMLQYYLRAAGLSLSWVGTGRFIFSHNYGDDDYAAVMDRFVEAAERMRDDGWWSLPPATTGKSIKKRVLREMLSTRFSWLPFS
jgi:glutamate-1-semialdehyde 2,1-aminomutase